MKYTILIIAIECHYSHVSRFIGNLKQENPEAVIHLMTNYEEADIPSVVLSNVSKIFHCSLSSKMGRVDKLLKAYKFRKAVRGLTKTSKYDVINIHFPHYYMAGIIPALHRMSKTIVVSPWGSDILRVEGLRQRMVFRGILQKCDVITTEIEGNIGNKILKNLPECRAKFYPQTWGSETIDTICRHISEYDTNLAKSHFGISNRYVITCGYNAFRAQNHMRIIESIAQVRNYLPKNLLLLFPVSYGGDKQYLESVKNKCIDEQFEALFIEDYLSVPEVGLLRMATDMFVHAQATDAGCASLQEYVLCKKKIVHGGWIKYPMLEAYPPLCYHIAPNFSSLGDTIIEAYRSEPIDFSQDLLNYIKSNGWVEKRKGWNAMFEKIAQINQNTAEFFVP